MSSDQGFFESDEDYQARVSLEANERIVEDSSGSAPSRGFFESDEGYLDRLSQEANEYRIEQSTGSAPSQSFWESSADYTSRVEQEANERAVEDATGSAPSQRFFEGNEEYNVRVRREANEHIVEQLDGTAPSQSWFEGDHEYRSRIAHEARLAKVNAPTPTDSAEGSNRGGSYDSAYGDHSYTAGSSTTAADSSSGVGIFLGFLAILAVGILLTTARSPSSDVVATGSNPNVPTLSEARSVISDPWDRAAPVPASFAEGIDLQITSSGLLLFDGIPMPLAFRYAGRETPATMLLSGPSSTGRYRLLTLCGADWCDDVRVIDLRRGRMLSFCCSKSGANNAIWTPDDRYALIARSHAGDDDVIALDLVTLQVTDTPLSFTQTIFGDETGDIDAPDGTPPSSPRLSIDLQSASWATRSTLVLSATVVKTQWTVDGSELAGRPVPVARLRLSISVPDLVVTVLGREALDEETTATSAVQAGSAPSMVLDDTATERRPPSDATETSSSSAAALPELRESSQTGAATQALLTSAAAAIDSSAADAYLVSAERLREALQAVDSLERTGGRSPESLALREETLRRLAETITACSAENAVNRARRAPVVPCPSRD